MNSIQREKFIFFQSKMRFLGHAFISLILLKSSFSIFIFNFQLLLNKAVEFEIKFPTKRKLFNG